MNSSPLNDIRVVAFDHDDTLVCSFYAAVAQHQFVAKKYFDFDISESDVRSIWGLPLTEFYRMLYNTTDTDSVIAVMDKHDSDFPRQLLDNVLETLDYLKRAGYILALVSSNHSIEIGKDWRDFCIDGNTIFDFVQAENDSRFHKPDPRVFDQLVNKMSDRGIERSRILYVGDSLMDGAAARDAGLMFVGVTTGLVGSDEFARHGFLSISRLEKLAEILPKVCPITKS